ncbi:collagen alpha-1(XIX) chain-like [Arapaima gigas]
MPLKVANFTSSSLVCNGKSACLFISRSEWRHFTCCREDMSQLLRWGIFLWTICHFTDGMAFSERAGGSCPMLRVQEERFLQHLKPHDEVTGFDLTEKFLLRKGTVAEDRPSFRLGGTLLIKQTELVFPNGLPNEYSLVATFRLRKTTKKDRWYLWQIFDESGSPQVSLIVDGAKKVVEFAVRGLLKNSLHYTFKSRDLHILFDRQWHKLSLAVQTSILSVYVDCKLIERRLTDEKDLVDARGRTVIATRVEDGRPVDIELQQILIYCDPKIAAIENCCEMPGSKCEQVDVTQRTPLPLASSYFPTAFSQPALHKSDACQCLAEKGEQGLPGLAGLPGLKGDKGDKGEPGEVGYPGKPGLKGDRGVDGKPGLDGTPGPKARITKHCSHEEGEPGTAGIDGEKGEKGAAGEPGLAGAPGKDGMKGDLGLVGHPGQKGDKGDAGAPGLPGLSIEREGAKGEPGLPGVSGEKGQAGPPGLPGAPGKEGKRSLSQATAGMAINTAMATSYSHPFTDVWCVTGTGPLQQWSVGWQNAKSEVAAALLVNEAGTEFSEGRRGKPGDPGTPGLPGPPGHSEGAEIKGEKGDSGSPGNTGEKGEKGDPGPPGEAGARGIKGEKGDLESGGTVIRAVRTLPDDPGSSSPV